MADEITKTLSLSVTNGNLDAAIDLGTAQVDQAAQGLIDNVQTVGTGAHEALELGDISTAGVFAFHNLDDANYVEVGLDVGATFYPFLKLEAGESASGRAGTNSLYAKANTANVKLRCFILED